jgi:hypothetical protein
MSKGGRWPQWISCILVKIFNEKNLFSNFVVLLRVLIFLDLLCSYWCCSLRFVLLHSFSSTVFSPAASAPLASPGWTWVSSIGRPNFVFFLRHFFDVSTRWFTAVGSWFLFCLVCCSLVFRTHTASLRFLQSPIPSSSWPACLWHCFRFCPGLVCTGGLLLGSCLCFSCARRGLYRCSVLLSRLALLFKSFNFSCGFLCEFL